MEPRRWAGPRVTRAYKPTLTMAFRRGQARAAFLPHLPPSCYQNFKCLPHFLSLSPLVHSGPQACPTLVWGNGVHWRLPVGDGRAGDGRVGDGQVGEGLGHTGKRHGLSTESRSLGHTKHVAADAGHPQTPRRGTSLPPDSRVPTTPGWGHCPRSCHQQRPRGLLPCVPTLM